MKNCYPILRSNLRRLFASPHLYVILVLSVLYMEYIFEPIRLYLQEANAKIGLFDLMTYYLNDSTVSAFMILCCVGLLFNIPCADDLQRYLLLRCGRKAWARGQLLYCVVVCVCYFLFLLLVLLVLILPWLELTLQWTPGVLAFVDEFVYEIYDSFLNWDIWLPRVYSPLAACSIQMGLHILIACMLSTLLANVNLIIDRRIGYAVIAAPTAFDLLLEEYFSESVNYFSPLTLCRLSGLDYGDGMGRPPILFAVGASIALIALFSLILVRYASRHEIRI